MDKCRVCQEFFASNEGLCSSCFRRERPEAAAALAAALNEVDFFFFSSFSLFFVSQKAP